MKQTITLLLLFFITNLLVAQNKLIFTNAQKIDHKRYSDFKGSPYLFDDWSMADIYDGQGKAIEQVELNFNGYTNEIEIKEGNQFIELDRKWYLKIEVQVEDKLMTFHRGVHDYFKQNFVELAYHGKNLLLVKRFRVSTSDKEINDVGKTIKIKRFDQRQEYFFIRGEELKSVKFKKKSLLKFLGHKKEIEKYLKTNKLKITRIEDLKKVLDFYEAQGY